MVGGDAGRGCGGRGGVDAGAQVGVQVGVQVVGVGTAATAFTVSRFQLNQRGLGCN